MGEGAGDVHRCVTDDHNMGPETDGLSEVAFGSSNGDGHEMCSLGVVRW